MILCKRARDIGVEITFDDDWLLVTIYNGLHYDNRSHAALMLMHFFDYTLEEATYYVSEREMMMMRVLQSTSGGHTEHPRKGTAVAGVGNLWRAHLRRRILWRWKAEELSLQLADRSQNPRIWQSRMCAAAQKRQLHRPARSRAATPRPRLGTNLSGPYPNVTHGSGQVHVYDNPCFVLLTSCSNVTDDHSRLVFANAIESKPDGWPCFELLSPLEPVLDRVLEGDWLSSPHCSATTEADSISDLVDVDASDDDRMLGLAEMSYDDIDDDLP
ncbi:hypothetical protein FOA52_004195 [Chlamydomonas sp. UWO 241]|nr:hypothetical protein FOA52_004195 [Chlamydomonas sp. UWO 241]